MISDLSIVSPICDDAYVTPGGKAKEMPGRSSGVVNISIIRDARDYIQKVYRERGIDILNGSVLDDYLGETDAFIQGRKSIVPPSTGIAQDELAISLGLKILTVYRLSESVRSLQARHTPQLTERLADLAWQCSGDQEQEQQFLAAEYETFSASEITIAGERVSFISSDQKSRYRRRVEYLITHRWPVECKRPRSSKAVITNLKLAIEKIQERGQNGLVFISLDEALYPEAYAEFMNIVEMNADANQRLSALWQEHREEIVAGLRETPVQAAVFTCTLMAYYHDTASVALPALEFGVKQDGSHLATNVIVECLQLLRAVG